MIFSLLFFFLYSIPGEAGEGCDSLRPSIGSSLKDLVSLAPQEVKYLYCIVQGKKIAPLRKDQFAVIANGRFSVSDAMKLPEPIRLQTSTDFVPEEDQKIPSE